MFRFYLGLLKDTPGVLIQAGNRLASCLLAVAGVAFLANRALAAKLIGWRGFSPLLAIIPLALLVVYGLAQANYARFRALEKTNAITNTTSPSVIAFPGAIVNVTQNFVQPPGPEPPAAR